jgi:hypothetical protein
MTDETQREYDQLKAVADTRRYKIRLKDDEPFMPGVRGQVEPYSLDGQVLAAFTDKPSVLKQMLALPFVQPHQVGQSEGSVLFSVAHFSAIADFLQLRKKRPRPSEAQIALGRAALRDFHTRHKAKKARQKTTNRREEVFQHTETKFIKQVTPER